MEIKTEIELSLSKDCSEANTSHRWFWPCMGWVSYCKLILIPFPKWPPHSLPLHRSFSETSHPHFIPTSRDLVFPIFQIIPKTLLDSPTLADYPSFPRAFSFFEDDPRYSMTKRLRNPNNLLDHSPVIKSLCDLAKVLVSRLIMLLSSVCVSVCAWQRERGRTPYATGSLHSVMWCSWGRIPVLVALLQN